MGIAIIIFFIFPWRLFKNRLQRDFGLIVVPVPHGSEIHAGASEMQGGRRRKQTELPVILTFESHSDDLVVIEGGILKFIWQVEKASALTIKTLGEAFDVFGTSECSICFYKSQEVVLEARNNAGDVAKWALPIHVVPLPRFEETIPFPDFVFIQEVPFSLPAIIACEPPQFSILMYALQPSDIINLTKQTLAPTLLSNTTPSDQKPQ